MEKKKILLSLIGNQVTPNLLPILEFRPNYNILVASRATKGIAKSIERALDNLNKIKIETIIVTIEDENKINYEKIEELLKDKNLDKDSCDFYFNLTGGTKQMAISLYLLSQKYENSILIYSLKSNKYLLNNKDTKEYKEKLDLETYLNALNYICKEESRPNDDNNIDVVYYTEKKPTKTPEFTEQVFNNYKKFVSHEIISSLRTKRDKKKVELKKEEIDFLKEVCLLPKDKQKNTLDKSEIDYITGGWLEEYIYNLIPVDKKDKKLSVKISKKIKNPKDPSELFLINNEFDVITLYNNQLYVFECKTIFADTEGLGSKLATETSYKSSALIKKFGMEDKSYIVYLNLEMPNYCNVIKNLRRRCTEERVGYMTPDEVKKLFPKNENKNNEEITK